MEAYSQTLCRNVGRLFRHAEITRQNVRNVMTSCVEAAGEERELKAGDLSGRSVDLL